MRELPLILTLMLASSLLQGQGPRTFLLAEGGAGSSWVNGTLVMLEDPAPRMGWVTGLHILRQMNDRWSWRAGLVFERRGYIERGYLLITDGPSDYQKVPVLKDHSFDRLAIPLLASRTFGGKTSFFVNAGPVFGITFEHRMRFGEPYIPERQVSWLGTFFNRAEVAVTGGAGISRNMSSRVRISLEARYQRGLSNLISYSWLNKPRQPHPSGNISSGRSRPDTRYLRSNTLNLLLGVGLRLGKVEGPPPSER